MDIPASAPSVAAAVQFAPAAARRLKQILKEEGSATEKALRLSVLGGGCSGFQYEFALEEAPPQEDDLVVETDGARLLVDAVSVPFLEGSVVDYEDVLIGARFVVRNPQVKSACGCGVSFAL